MYLEREDWPETSPFADWLSLNARSQNISRQQLEHGNFIDELLQLWNKSPPNVPSANDIDEALELLSNLLGLS